jgi:hexosaminidase
MIVLKTSEWIRKFSVISLAAAMIFSCLEAHAATASPLFARGYTVLPSPQKVKLGEKDFRFSKEWRLQLGSGVPVKDVAVQSLDDELQSRFQISLNRQGKGASTGNLHLEILPGSVAVGDASDRDKTALAEQAYKMTLSENNVSITANALPGLFYGVQTFIQLLKPQGGGLWLPEGEIVDWPDLELRVMYWDDAHHLDRPGVLEQAIRQAAFYKINGFSIKLEGHFQFKSAPPVVEPYALTPAELQSLTDLALKYHVQLIPFLDGPAHVSFILKHPEYSQLREYPESNYEFCSTNPGTYKLLQGMFQDLLDANKGGKYVVLSTDEPYYIGLAKNEQCNEADRAQELGSVGKMLGEFVTKMGTYLRERGRTVIFWGEYPMVPGDISSFPSFMVNGEIYGPDYDPVYKAHGIRQLVYTSTQGVEPFFPDYYSLPADARLHAGHHGEGRVAGMLDRISGPALESWASDQSPHVVRDGADVMGTFVAGWGDSGLHPETFWLGYATGPAAGWHPISPDPNELMNSFYRLFYGPGASSMGRLYQLMSEQAQFWEDSWEKVPSTARSPLFGNSDQVFNPPRPETDQTLPPLPIPSGAYLELDRNWSTENARRLKMASDFLAQNDELRDLLRTNMEQVEFNRYNLEVYLSVAELCRQNLEMILALGRIDRSLKSASVSAARPDAAEALAALDEALNMAESIRDERNRALQDATTTWYKTWYPRVAEANGRTYLDQVDNVKDHVPVRTVDMSYLVYRELLFPLGEWAERVKAVRNSYAEAHNLPQRQGSLDWNNYPK